jgi:mono/diheme cytochrome c family protein
MLKNGMILLGALLVSFSICLAQEKTDTKPVVVKTAIKETSPASGKEMFTQYCATCHGTEGKGMVPPPL